MMPLDDIRVYLPKYLSEESYEQLIAQLRDFPGNLDESFYTSNLEPTIIYQGDGLRDMPIVNVDNLSLGVKSHPCIIISNTCDMDLANNRLFPSTILYAPILQLKKYADILKHYHVSNEKIQNHITQIRAQKVSSVFYLPNIEDLGESIVYLDRILHVSQKYVDRQTLQSRRVFSLSNYGFYLFVFKLSIHFTRIREGVDRGA